MSKIIDIHGNPFKFNDEVQTENDSRLAMLQKHYSEHPCSGLSPMRAAHILKYGRVRRFSSSSELAEDMEEKDLALQSEAK